jgi:hypothetical protein
VKYGIEYQDRMEHVWHCPAERYPSAEDAQSAIGNLIALGGAWKHRAYRVRPKPATEPTRPELVRLVERLTMADTAFAFWGGENDEEAVLFNDRVAIAVPGSPVWEGSDERPIGVIVWEIRERAERERAESAERERAERERAERERVERERAERERVERERAERERVEQERAERERLEQERAEQERAAKERAQLEQAQREQAQREHVAKERAERERTANSQREHAVSERAAALPVTAKPPLVAQVAPAASPAKVAPVAWMSAPPPPRVAPAAPVTQPPRAVPVAWMGTPVAPPRIAPVARAAAPVAPPPRVAPVAPPRVAPVARTVAPVAHLPRDPPNLPPSQSGADSERVALAKLLRCGAWREGMRASAIVASNEPEGLPAGAHRALQDLAGVAQPTARELGNALKRVLGKRIDGISRKVTRRTDGHGFAVWQVVNDRDETNEKSERPTNAELVRSALTGMGYRRAEAEYAVSALGARVDTEQLAELVREALGVLAQRPVPGPNPKRK